MSQVHIHLIITHLPIFGSLIGLLVLLLGIIRKNKEVEFAAFYIFIVSAIGAGIAYLTGEGPEEAVEHLPGITKNLIEEHEEFSMFALISLIVLGASSLLALFLNYRSAALSGSVTKIILLISIISFVLVGYTGYLGGQIRHSELNAPTAINNATEQVEKEDTD